MLKHTKVLTIQGRCLVSGATGGLITGGLCSISHKTAGYMGVFIMSKLFEVDIMVSAVTMSYVIIQ